jgi:hypothetical protein
MESGASPGWPEGDRNDAGAVVTCAVEHTDGGRGERNHILRRGRTGVEIQTAGGIKAAAGNVLGNATIQNPLPVDTAGKSLEEVLRARVVSGQHL